MKDYKKKYETAIKQAKEELKTCGSLNCDAARQIFRFFPELKESEDEKIRKGIVKYLEQSQFGEEHYQIDDDIVRDYIAWLEKQGDKDKLIKKLSEYKVKYTQEVLSQQLEKQDKQPNKVSIWKHWGNGIAGNGECEPVFLIKNGDTYSLSSCLGYECDYIELSELNKLLPSKKQDEHKGLDYPYVAGWRKNYKDNKPKVKHSVLMFTTHGIAEGEWLGGEWCQYRWSCKIKDEDVLYWLHLSDLENLEKENGEQKPSDKVEPKFKVGNWYLCVKDFVGKGVRFDKEHTYYCGLDGCLQEFDTGAHIDIDKKLYDYFNLWTIQDAKKGDILSYDKSKCIAIFLKIESVSFKDICFIDAIDGKFYIGGWHTIENAHPATKEQCDLLFQKIKEAGYEWDAEKKELKKIEQVQLQPKQEWSEEDEKIIKGIIDDIQGRLEDYPIEQLAEIYFKEISWLKCLKERIQPQLKQDWKPSDEQMRELGIVATGMGWFNKEVLSGLLEQLKKLREE